MQELNSRNITEIRNQFGDDFVEKVTVSALNKAAPKLQTYISKSIRQRYNITAADVKRKAKRFKAKRSADKVYQASVLFQGSPIGYTNFSAKPKKVTIGRKTKKGRPWGRFRTGVSVKVLKSSGQKQIKSRPAFLAVGMSGNRQVFYRDPRGRKTSTGKTALHSMKGPSIPDMVLASEGDTGEPYDVFAAQEFDTEFDRATDYYLSKMNG